MTTMMTSRPRPTASFSKHLLALLAAFLLPGPLSAAREEPNLACQPLLDLPFLDFRAGFACRPPKNTHLDDRCPQYCLAPHSLQDWDLLQRPESRILARFTRDDDHLDFAVYRLVSRSNLSIQDLLAARLHYWQRHPAVKILQTAAEPNRSPPIAQLSFLWHPPDQSPSHLAEGIVQAAPDRFFLLALALPPGHEPSPHHQHLLQPLLENFLVLDPHELSLRQRQAREHAARILQNLQQNTILPEPLDRWFRLYKHNQPVGFYRLHAKIAPTNALELRAYAWIDQGQTAQIFFQAAGWLGPSPENLLDSLDSRPASLVAAFRLLPQQRREQFHWIIRSANDQTLHFQGLWNDSNLTVRHFQNQPENAIAESFEINEQIYLPHSLNLLGCYAHDAQPAQELLFLCYANRTLRYLSVCLGDSHVPPAPFPPASPPKTYLRSQTGADGPFIETWLAPDASPLRCRIDTGLLLVAANEDDIRLEFPKPAADLDAITVNLDWPDLPQPSPKTPNAEP